MAEQAQTLRDLALARGGLDRCAAERSVALVGTLLEDPATRVLALRGDRAPVDPSGGLRLRGPEAADHGRLAAFLGRDEERTAYLLVVEDPLSAPEEGWTTLRAVGADLGDRDAGLLATSLALANWHRAHGFCPRCGTATGPELAGWIRRCPEDGSEHYPRTDPAVIMSVVDDTGRILLARGKGFRAKGVSVLAGFVEPGESFAGAVAREVFEEVGVRVVDPVYLGDQPWPFPSSLMVGFTCRAVTTEITMQEDEIEAARWWSRDELAAAVASGEVLLSPRVSIARRIIERWYGSPIRVPDTPLR